MITFTLAILALVAIAAAGLYVHSRKYIGGSIAVVLAIAFGLLSYWSAATIEGNDTIDGVTPTAPSISATPTN